MTMSMVLLLAALVASQTAVSGGTTPDVKAVESAMNEGVEIEFPQFQELADVEFVRGGATREGRCVFICKANLVWKLGVDEFIETLEREIDKALQAGPFSEMDEMVKALGAGDFFSDLGQQAISLLRAQTGEFKKGEVVTAVRFRAGLEEAGGEWVVVDSKIVELGSNPLRSMMKREPAK
jgi:hypothetical protein